MWGTGARDTDGLAEGVDSRWRVPSAAVGLLSVIGLFFVMGLFFRSFIRDRALLQVRYE